MTFKNSLLFALWALTTLAFAQEKWTVSLPDGTVYSVGRSEPEAAERAAYRQVLEKGPESNATFRAVRSLQVPTPERRRQEEEANEVLNRLAKLQRLAEASKAPSIGAEVRLARDRSLEGSEPLKALDTGIEKVLIEAAILDLEAGKDPQPDVWPLGETIVLSDFEKCPAGFRTGYLALLERLDRYRAASSATTEPSRQRDRLLRGMVVPGGESRLAFVSSTSGKGVAAVRYRMVSRSETERKEAVVVDVWKGQGGNYRLTSCKVEAVPTDGFAGVRQRIVQNARQELARMQERVAQREEEVRKRIEEERRRKAEEERLENERRDREERERQDQETKRRQREEYVRQFDTLRGEFDRVARERDDAASGFSSARREYEVRADEASRLRQVKEAAASRVRELESDLESAKREGKPTGIIEQVLREARQQYEDKQSQYHDADRRADSARSRAESFERAIRDLEGRMGQIESELSRLKSLIDSLT